MHQRACGRIQKPENRQGDRCKIDGHGQGDAELDRPDRGVGQPLQIGNF